FGPATAPAVVRASAAAASSGRPSQARNLECIKLSVECGEGGSSDAPFRINMTSVTAWYCSALLRGHRHSTPSRPVSSDHRWPFGGRRRRLVRDVFWLTAHDVIIASWFACRHDIQEAPPPPPAISKGYCSARPHPGRPLAGRAGAADAARLEG